LIVMAGILAKDAKSEYQNTVIKPDGASLGIPPLGAFDPWIPVTGTKAGNPCAPAEQPAIAIAVVSAKQLSGSCPR
jgi:hypothetical protein